MIKRKLVNHLRELLRYYPVISVTGPRQAGKTTLLREMLPDYHYLSFETPTVRQDFITDPLGFLRQYGDRVIFDEAQHVPELFSFLQTNIDLDRRPGRFVLSGSQNFLLRKNITQSLAGRIGIARLLPLDFQEMKEEGTLAPTHLSAMLGGAYPERHVRNIPPKIFYANYLDSYVRRDVVGLVDTTNLSAFERFIGLVAGQTGQLVNYSAMSVAVGVSVPTIKSWLSILEQSYLIFQLTPYFKNTTRRLVKAPKIYFYDTGLLCYLLRITTEEQLRTHYQYGGIFENLIISDAYKTTYHLGERPAFHFFRDKNGTEVDLLRDAPEKVTLWEIKATETYHPRLARTMRRVASSIFSTATMHVVYGGNEKTTLDNVTRLPWRELSWKE